MTTHAPDRPRAPISALRLLDGVTETTSSARLDLDALFSLMSVLARWTVVSALNDSVQSVGVDATQCATLMNSPG